MSRSLDQERFTISEVVADRHEIMAVWRTVLPSFDCSNGHLDLHYSEQACHHPIGYFRPTFPTGLILPTHGPFNVYSAQRLDLFARCVRLSRLLVGFRTHFKSLHFYSFIHSFTP